MIDLNRRGFLSSVLATAAAPSMLYRKQAGMAATLPPDLAAVVPGDEEVVAYEDGPATGEARVVICAAVRMHPLRLERSHGIKYLAHGPDRSVYLYFRDALPHASYFLVPRDDDACLAVVCQNPKYVRVAAYRLTDGSETSVDFDMLVLQHAVIASP